MQKNKIYSLKLNISHIQSDLLSQSRKYCLKATRNSLQKCTPVAQPRANGRLPVNQSFEFCIIEGQLDRQTKCLIQLCEENKEGQIEERARYELIVMEYKNYSKKIFKMTSEDNSAIELHMTMCINSTEETKSNENIGLTAIKATNNSWKQSEDEGKKKQAREVRYESPAVKSQTSQFSERQLIKRDEDVANIVPTFQIGKILESIGEKKNSLDSQFQKQQQAIYQNTLKVPPQKDRNVNEKKTYKESRYCKEIQQNLDYFSSNSSNNQLETGLFDSLHRIKNKFTKVQEDEQLLNSEELYKNEEMNKLQRKGQNCFHKLKEKKSLRINQCFSYKFHLGNACEPKADTSHLSARRRYQLAKAPNVSPFNETIIFKHNACLSESQLNFEVEEQSLNRVSYIKINKISHLTKEADIARRNNLFLIEANEQLKKALKVAEQRLEISKSIISQKEDILQKQFEAVKGYMINISNKLTLKHEEAKKREEKIIILQQQIERYTREINTLKAENKGHSITIKDLKGLLALKEEKDEPSTKETLAETKQTKNRVARINMTKEEEQISPFSVSYSTQKRPNSLGIFDEAKVKKKSSLQNEIKVTEVEDKSDVGSQKTYKRFSRSKVQSNSMIEQKSYRTGTNPKTDDIFIKLNQLLLGNSEERVLKDL